MSGSPNFRCGYKMTTDVVALASELTDVVGPGNTFTGIEAAEYGHDARGVVTGPVLVAVRPGSTEEVAAVVRVCADRDLPIVTQGGNTGLSGGAQPIDQQASVLVSLSRMRELESIDIADSTITVQAGATIESIQNAAGRAGAMFAPDWGASGTASIGGAISTNAGGVNVLQYGPMRDQVLGLEVVLADGRIWNGLRRLRKDSSGYQLRQLFIGAEGTLGIITRAVVRLLPAIADHQTAILALPTLDAALPLLAAARSGGRTVVAFELLPEVGLGTAVDKFELQRPMETVAKWYIIARLAAPLGSGPTAMNDFLAEAAAANLILDAAVAATTDQEDNLWMIREMIRPVELWDWVGGYIKYDAAVPVGRVVEFIERVETLTAALAPGWLPFSFGHLGDGNIHLHVLPPIGGFEPAHRAALEAAIDALTLELEGTLTAEHGVGQSLLDQMTAQKDPLEVELAWRIKDSLDPDGLFNPGKTLPPR